MSNKHSKPMDSKILNLIKKDETLYNVLKSIVDIEELFEAHPTKFETLDLALESITNILSHNHITQKHADSKVKNVHYKDLKILGFRNGSSEESHINLILCKFLTEFGSYVLYEKYKVSIVACSFGWDSSSYFLIGGRQEKLNDDNKGNDYANDFDDCYYDRKTLNDFVLKTVELNGDFIYC